MLIWKFPDVLGLILKFARDPGARCESIWETYYDKYGPSHGPNNYKDTKP